MTIESLLNNLENYMFEPDPCGTPNTAYNIVECFKHWSKLYGYKRAETEVLRRLDLYLKESEKDIISIL